MAKRTARDTTVRNLNRRLRKALMREWVWRERAEAAEYHLGRAVAELEYIADEEYREAKWAEWDWVH